MIEKYIQGQKKTDSLFAKIGNWVVSKEVHKILGMEVTAEEGDIWHLAIDDDEPKGFAETRIMKNKKAHIRYCYSPSKQTRELLVKAVIKMASDMKLEAVYTNDRSTATFWKDLGFKRNTKSNNSFHRWERELQ